MVTVFIWFDKRHIVINSLKIIWISNVANSRNVDLTGKQHSRHKKFRRIPLSPLDASRPRSRVHLFSHSMSKASPPQGPDIWYLKLQSDIHCNRSTTSPRLKFITIAEESQLGFAVGRRLVGDWSGTGCRLIGDWSATLWGPLCDLMQLVADRSGTGPRPVADRSPTKST